MQDRLFIFVEGDDDELFFSKVVKPILKTNCIIIKYAQKRKIADYALNIKKMKADYLFVGDIDLKACVTAKKQNISHLYKLDEDKIIIVIKEIESWYLAGLDESRAKRFGIPIVRDTQKIDKETFEREFIPKQFKNKIDFLNEHESLLNRNGQTKKLIFSIFCRKIPAIIKGHYQSV